MYTSTHIYTPVHTYTHTHTCKHVKGYVSMHKYLHVHIYAYTDTYLNYIYFLIFKCLLKDINLVVRAEPVFNLPRILLPTIPH